MVMEVLFVHRTRTRTRLRAPFVAAPLSIHMVSSYALPRQPCCPMNRRRTTTPVVDKLFNGMHHMPPTLLRRKSRAKAGRFRSDAACASNNLLNGGRVRCRRAHVGEVAARELPALAASQVRQQAV
jgi:hypothetical protein